MKTRYFFLLSAIAFVLAGCEDHFFETESPSAMNTSVFLSPSSTEQAIGGIYNIFGEDKSFRNRLCGGYVALNTDIEYCNKSGGQAREASIYALSKGTGDLSTSNGKDPWAYLTAAIERANVVIEGIRQYSDTTDAEFRYLLGEALTLRAFCFIEMVKLWGDVPATFKAFDGQHIEDLYHPKEDRNVIYEQLRIDLKDAARLMPWSTSCPGRAANNIGRPSKALALGLLARMDMMYAGKALRPKVFTVGGTTDCSVDYNVKDAGKRQELYQEVVWACAQIIKEEGDYKLRPDFEGIWRDLCADVTDYQNSEFIWALPFMDGARGQVLALSGLKISTNTPGILKNTISYGEGNSNNTKVQGMIQVVPTFLWDFDPADKRRDVTICTYGWEYDNGSGVGSEESIFPGSELGENKLYQKIVAPNSWYLGKYRVEWMQRSYSNNEDCIDMPVLRYADILLMFAEAAIGSKEGNAPSELYGIDPQDCFDKVRARAGLGSKSKSVYDFNNIVNERAFEFCGENIRKYDLMRWDMLGEKLEKTMERIADLDAGRGDFAGRMDSVYFTYKEDDSYAIKGKAKAYVLDKVIGFHAGDKVPDEYDKANGWVRKNIYEKDGTRHLSPSTYLLYKKGVDVDKRHYWPIFDVNINASNGKLWNDYGY